MQKLSSTRFKYVCITCITLFMMALIEPICIVHVSGEPQNTDRNAVRSYETCRLLIHKVCQIICSVIIL